MDENAGVKRLSLSGFILCTLWFCLLTGDVSAQLAPECSPGGHSILRNPYRSVEFDSSELQNTAIQELVCDHSLAPGWYRFMLGDLPAEMPTSCVEMNRCGSQAPVWLQVEEAGPGALPEPGEVKQLSACATWRFFHASAKDCCLFRLPVTVRHCGDFLLYFLLPTQGCMGYCAQATSRKPLKTCRPGEVEVGGVCKVALPSLASRPLLSSELVGSSVHLRCSYAALRGSLPLGYVVVWARYTSPSMKVELRRERTTQLYARAEMDGVHFRLGETFSCSVSTYLLNSSRVQSASRESSGFFAGIKFVPETLHIREDSKEHEVAVHSTVPISCYGLDPARRCRLMLALSVHEADGLAASVRNVALSSCHVELESRPCFDGVCGRGTFALSAVTDFARDGNRASLITARPTVAPGSGPRLWRRYVPPPLKVTVQDVPTSNCYVLTDPHVLTFDGRRFENQQTGTFVMCRTTGRTFEVHTRQWNCGSRHYPVACTCGLAAREGNEVVIFDMCDGQLRETRPAMSIKTLRPASERQVKIHEAHQGKKVTMLFPSGAFVRADVSDWGMSVSVRVPSRDFNRTQGLCGTFDRNGHNDFHSADGGVYQSGNVARFIQDWRLAPGESLFDGTPPADDEEIKSGFCACQDGFASSFDSPTGPGTPTGAPALTSCLSRDNVAYTSIFPIRDATAEYSEIAMVRQQARRHEAILEMPTEIHAWSKELPDTLSWEDLGKDSLISITPEPLLSSSRIKRQNTMPFQTIQSFSDIDLESLAYFFPDDHISASRPLARPSWPTPSGLTSAKALEVCRHALVNSTVGMACARFLGRRLEEAVDLCILDLQLKDDLEWEDALLPFLENECERRWLEDRTQSSAMTSGAAEDVAIALRCPNLCHGKGRCLESGCQCNPGHSHYDCSLTFSQPVELTDLENGGLCDVRSSDCDSVRVFGLGFIESPELSCSITRLERVKDAWLSGETQRTKATFLSSTAIDCTVPRHASIASDTGDFLADQQPYARWEIKLSNDGVAFSNEKVFTLYDGVCQQCVSTPSGLCKLKERRCSIEGVCYVDGDVSPSSVCLSCNSSASTHTWTLNQANRAPSFWAPAAGLQAFRGEELVLQLRGADPEGSALLFRLDAGPPGASLGADGLLTWRVALDHKEKRSSVGFSMTDECGARGEYSVEVAVIPCGCENGGTCVTDVTHPAGSGEYLCVCPPGYHGKLCQHATDFCESDPCGLGTCVNGADGFRCLCPAGTTGWTCQQDVDECEGSPCFPGVRCTNTFGSFECSSCPQGSHGDGFTCTASQVTPPAVSRIYPPSDSKSQTDPPLHPKLTSIETARPRTSATTRTASGITQKTGVLDARNTTVRCSSRPCFPGVHCIDLRPPYSGYVCGRCPPGYHGNGRACTKHLKQPAPSLMHGSSGRLIHTSVTDPHAVLRDTKPSLKDTNVVLKSQSLRYAHSSPPSRHHLRPLSVSTRTGPSPHRPLPLTPPPITERRDVMALSLRHAHVTRRNLGTSGTQTRASADTFKVVAGGFVAVTPGDTLEVTQKVTPHIPNIQSRSRTPIDSHRSLTAALAPVYFSPESDFSADGSLGTGNDETLNAQMSLTTVGKRSQVTPLRIHRYETGRDLIGQDLDLVPNNGVTCEDVECFPGVQCELVGDGILRCGRCPMGFTGDGRMCRAVCRRGCARNMECAAPNTCRCKPGYTGPECQTAICRPECQNGGVCIAPGVCECREGYHGEICERVLCSPPCLHGGSCVGRDACSCPYGFVGPRCETMVCNRHCHNGGKCVSPDECECQPGWTGSSCETAMCDPACRNGGVCVRQNSCSCLHGFYGAQCQNAICSPPCKNGGLCVRNGVCSCADGYSGPLCEKSVCEPMCMNGGRCVGPGVCDCVSGWRGRRCDKPTCLQKCLNGGECVGSNTCHCSPGWQGTLCQTPVCEHKCLFGSRCVRPNVCSCRTGFTGPLCARKLPIGQR